MKTIPLATLCLILALVSCGEKLSRRDVAEEYLAQIRAADAADYQVGKLRMELEIKPDAGKAQLLGIDLKTAMAAAEKAKAGYLHAYGEWLEVEAGKPDFSGPLEAYKTALIMERVAAERGKDEEYSRLRDLDFTGVMNEFRGK